MSPAIESCLSSGNLSARLPLPTLTEADRARVAPRLRSGAVLWDLRPLHEVQRAPVPGAVNLGQVDWLVEDRASGRLQPPSVIAKILARVGIVPGCSVVLYAGSRAASLTLARRALLTIGIDQVEAIVDQEDDATTMSLPPVRHPRAEAVVASEA